MLFHSSVRKELSRSFGATLIVLITVVMTMTLIRTLGQATRGSFAPQDIMLAMGFALLADTPSILSLSLFIAVITTLSRMYRDSEMTIWFASGVGLNRFVGPVLRVSWPVLLVIGLLALVVWQFQIDPTSGRDHPSHPEAEYGLVAEAATPVHLAAALAIDAFGLLGSPLIPITLSRVAGIALAVVGFLLARR